MTFQAYIDNIKSKIGKTPEELKELAEKAGVYKPDMKAAQLVEWLNKEFKLGHGHAMAIGPYLKTTAGLIHPKSSAYTCEASLLLTQSLLYVRKSGRYIP